MLATVATAFSDGQAEPQKKVQIKIIVDGKEIDLNDAQLWQHIEAAQKKAVDVMKDPRLWQSIEAAQNKAVDVIKDVRFLETIEAVQKQAVDATKRAETAALQNLPRQPQRYTVRAVLADKPATDPRIEELVKQAEAIKPGSGAAIRDALQGTPKPGGLTAGVVIRNPTIDFSAKPYAGTADNKEKPRIVRLSTTPAGKKIIVLSIEDGKVIQLEGENLIKILEKGARLDAEKILNLVVDPVKRWAVKESKPIAGVTPAEDNVRSRSPDTKSTSPSSDDMRELRIQIERIAAEMNVLKQRLADVDADKRRPGEKK
jgi:hypothetical protein